MLPSLTQLTAFFCGAVQAVSSCVIPTERGNDTRLFAIKDSYIGNFSEILIQCE
jgi:hypothetical protein